VQIIYSANYQQIPLLIVAVIWYLVMTSVLYIGQYFIERRFGRGASRDLPLTPWQRIARSLSLRRRPGEPVATPEAP
jgi:polar amino acid transport system permease protein